MFVSENLNVRVGKIFAEQPDGGQCQNEITDGAAANDEDTGAQGATALQP